MKATLFCILFITGIYAQAQDTCVSSQLCGKKWYGEKWMDKKGKFHKFGFNRKGWFVIFNSDGTFINYESIGLPIKGHWTLNESDKRLVLIEDKKRAGIPKKTTATIIYCTGAHLSFVRYSFDEKMTVYSVAR